MRPLLDVQPMARKLPRRLQPEPEREYVLRFHPLPHAASRAACRADTPFQPTANSISGVEEPFLICHLFFSVSFAMRARCSASGVARACVSVQRAIPSSAATPDLNDPACPYKVRSSHPLVR